MYGLISGHSLLFHWSICLSLLSVLYCFDYCSKFLMRYQLLISLRKFLYVRSCFSLLLPSKFSFISSIRMCTSVDLLEFILTGICWASWICRLIFFIKYGKFLSIIFSNALFTPFCPSSASWDSHNIYVGMIDGAPQVFEALFIFLFSFIT